MILIKIHIYPKISKTFPTSIVPTKFHNPQNVDVYFGCQRPLALLGLLVQGSVWRKRGSAAAVQLS